MEAFPGEGEWLDGYRIGERLHSGGMGLILKVTPEVDPGFPVIMKVPRLGYGEPGESITSYEQEQMVCRSCRALLAPLRGGGRPGQAALPGPRVRRGNVLREWVRKAPLAPEEVARLGAALATAAPRPAPAGGDPPRREAVERDHPAHRRGRAHRLRPRQPRPLPGPLAEEMHQPMGSAPTSPRSRCWASGPTRAATSSRWAPSSTSWPPASCLSARPPRRPACAAASTRSPSPPRAVNPAVPEWLQEVILHCLEPDARRVRFGCPGRLRPLPRGPGGRRRTRRRCTGPGSPPGSGGGSRPRGWSRSRWCSPPPTSPAPPSSSPPSPPATATSSSSTSSGT